MTFFQFATHTHKKKGGSLNLEVDNTGSQQRLGDVRFNFHRSGPPFEKNSNDGFGALVYSKLLLLL